MDISSECTTIRPWHSLALKFAAINNFLAGLSVAIYPADVLSRVGNEAMAENIELWRYCGVTIFLYGIGYWCASRAPQRHWPIVLIGLLGKILGPMAFISTALSNQAPVSPGIIFLLAGVLWAVPFLAILVHARYSYVGSKFSSQFVYSSVNRRPRMKRREAGTVVRMTVRAAGGDT